MNAQKSFFGDFTNLYSLQKTLRFELEPQGKTLEHIENKGLISQDEQRAESYKKMKKTIDGFHKHFIEIAMSQVKLTKLKEFVDLYNASPERKKEDGFKKSFEKVQTELRKEIAMGFRAGEAKEIFSKIDKKELVTDLLEKWMQTQEEDLYFDESFKTFTTYFGGFHKNRKNMYTDKEQSTSIAYRLVHENLPKFLDNIKVFERIKSIPVLYEKCTTLYTEIKEHLDIKDINEAFNLYCYNKVLTQKQIDAYNLVIGGMTAQEGKKKIQGLNEHINLYNQRQDKKDRIPKLKQLYKQILSDRESVSFLPEAFEDDESKTASQKVLNSIEEYYQANLVSFHPRDKDEAENVLEKIKELLTSLKDYDSNKIYLRNDKAITDISKALFGDWGIIKVALEFAFLQTLKIGEKGLSKKQEKEKENYIKQSHFSVAEIEKALFAYKNEAEVLNDLHENTTPLADYFHTNFLAKKKEESDKEFDLIANIQAKYSCIKGILNRDYPKEKRLHQDKKTIGDIKAFLDSLMELLHFVKQLSLPSDTTLEKDEIFYSQFQPWYDQLQLLIPLYNKVRNYASQKPYSIEKFKLNFQSSTLAQGWDLNKEHNKNYSFIFQENDSFLLGIINIYDDKDILSKDTRPEIFVDDSPLKKMVYKNLGDIKRQLPRIAFSDKAKKCVEKIGWNQEIEAIKKEFDEFQDAKKNDKDLWKDEFDRNQLSELIDYYKGVLKNHSERYEDTYKLEYKSTESYKNLGEFFDHITSQTYKVTFVGIDKNYINRLVDQGKLYLFQIYNKDFSEYSKGKPNLHTLYWKALFDPENLKDVMYKLNGGAELFYRKKSIKDLAIHKANEPIKNKNPNNPKKESVFKYEIVKDYRYTVDKFHFHVPITLNFKATEAGYINNTILGFLKDNPDVNIIGIDRGERHLIYLTLIDQRGNILEQRSLNTIINKKFNVKTDYHGLLDNREKERDKARKNWGTIETIKELKEGYIGIIVHEISRMMVEHNAIVVMEDLNFGFKRGRFKVEKQIYQKLEKKLIDKLNYLIFKDKANNETGGLYKALQLTSKFESFIKLGKQSGFLFYVPAWNTSKIDPTTGFVNLFNTRYENADKAKTFFDNFENICYNVEKGYFEFKVKKYSLFNSKADDTRQEWIICTQGDRIRTFRNPEKSNQWDNKEIVLLDEFKNLFKEYGIRYEEDLKHQILSQTEKTFFEKLLNLFKITVQMRNSITNSETDYLISPVMNAKGEFYDSRKAGDNLPKDADANGAYHIAKKGLWLLKQIDAHEGEDWKKLKLAITNKEWLQFAQARGRL
ncbi:MAG TPA: type V CRISPR-associated protein Cpf1 [Deltaproteobacteria bacterium]|nr:type V CRISPR-associated protein Cpf1 [Deltaproteobacteria bacterium]